MIEKDFSLGKVFFSVLPVPFFVIYSIIFVIYICYKLVDIYTRFCYTVKKY